MAKDLAIIVRGSTVAFIGKAIGILLGFIQAIIIARFVGSGGMGSFFLGLTLLNILCTFSVFGLDRGLLKYVSIYRSQGNYSFLKGAILRASSFSFLLSLIISLGLFTLSGFLATAVFADPNLSCVLKTLAFAIPIFSVWKIVLEALRGFKAIPLIVLNQNIVFPLTIIGLLFVFCFFTGRNVASIAYAYSSAVLLALLLALVFLRGVFPDIIRIAAASEFKELLKYSAPLLLVAAMRLAMSWIDIIMLGAIKTSPDVGIYAAASKTAAFVTFFIISVNAIIPPFFAEYYKDEKLKELEAIARTSARWILYVSLPVTALIILHSKKIMAIYGGDFSVGIGALVFLSLGHLISASAGSVGNVLAMTGHQKNLSFAISLSAVLNISLNAFLIPKWGITGAGLATGFSIAFLNILMAFVVYRSIGVKAYADRIPTVSWICAIAVVGFLLCKQFLPFYLATVAFVVLYFGLLYSIGLKDEDKEFFTLVNQKLKGTCENDEQIA